MGLGGAARWRDCLRGRECTIEVWYCALLTPGSLRRLPGGGQLPVRGEGAGLGVRQRQRRQSLHTSQDVGVGVGGGVRCWNAAATPRSWMYDAPNRVKLSMV
jgi:hypothetical protein